jgi:hypothetical protein
MNLASEEHQTLIHIALKGGKARAHWRHGKFNALDKAGLTEVVSKGEIYTTHKLTPAGIEAVLNMPDDLEVDLFPLPIDIARAKRIVGELK